MKRFSFARQFWLVLVLSCQPPVPVLELSVGGLRVDGEATVTVTATNGDMTPGAGTVALSTTLGMLDSTSLPLTEGSARTKLRCPRSTPGCAANGTIDVTARWTAASGALTQTVTVKLTDPPPSDGGRFDAGVDAGTSDAGRGDGGVDAGPAIDSGVIILGTPLTGLGDVFVFGRLGAPRTIGFTPFAAPASVLLGFDRLPERVTVINDRLIYIRGGVAFVWSEDYLDGGPPVPVDAGDPDAGDPDAGDPDAGDPDAGDPDAGDPDAGFDAGPSDAGADGGSDAGLRFGAFPLFGPERNDPVLFDCRGRLGSDPDAGVVLALVPTPSGSLWIGCGLSAAEGVSIYFRGTSSFQPPPRVNPLAANNDTVFGSTNDGGLYLLNQTSVLSMSSRPRAFSRSARATATGFEVLTYDPDSSKCTLGLVNLQGEFSELPLPSGFPQNLGCLDGVLYGRRDAVLFPSLGPQLGFRAFSFTRPVPPRDGGTDGGTADGGRDAGPADAGRSDAGQVDAGSILSFPFVEGPRSDFFDAGPYSIDFSFPVELVVRP